MTEPLTDEQMGEELYRALEENFPACELLGGFAEDFNRYVRINYLDQLVATVSAHRAYLGYSKEDGTVRSPWRFRHTLMRAEDAPYATLDGCLHNLVLVLNSKKTWIEGLLADKLASTPT